MCESRCVTPTPAASALRIWARPSIRASSGVARACTSSMEGQRGQPAGSTSPGTCSRGATGPQR